MEFKIPTTPDVSEFRLFCNDKWYEHKDEVYAWTGKPVQGTPEQYFAKYKWFLKTLYKESKRR